MTTLPESRYRELFAKQMRGRQEVHLELGRADVLTATHVVEIEPIDRWAHGARQAMSYGHLAFNLGHDVEPALAVYGSIPSPTVELIWRRASPFVDLFVLRDTTWEQLTADTLMEAVCADPEAIEAAIAYVKPRRPYRRWPKRTEQEIEQGRHLVAQRMAELLGAA